MDGKTLAALFGTSQALVEANLAGINHEDSLVCPERGGNCINWIAGHILIARGAILNILGGEPFFSEEESKIYGRGSTTDVTANAVRYDRILEGLKLTGDEVVKRLNLYTDEQMSEILDSSLVPIKLPVPTRAAIIQAFLFHEAYHVGQTGLCRRVLGRESAIK